MAGGIPTSFPKHTPLHTRCRRGPSCSRLCVAGARAQSPYCRQRCRRPAPLLLSPWRAALCCGGHCCCWAAPWGLGEPLVELLQAGPGFWRGCCRPAPWRASLLVWYARMVAEVLLSAVRALLETAPPSRWGVKGVCESEQRSQVPRSPESTRRS